MWRGYMLASCGDCILGVYGGCMFWIQTGCNNEQYSCSEVLTVWKWKDSFAHSKLSWRRLFAVLYTYELFIWHTLEEGKSSVEEGMQNVARCRDGKNVFGNLLPKLQAWQYERIKSECIPALGFIKWDMSLMMPCKHCPPSLVGCSLVPRPTSTDLPFLIRRGAEEGSGNIAIPFLYQRLDSGATNQITERHFNAKITQNQSDELP